MGRWYREGLTQNQWDKFPQKIKNRYPYQAQLPQADWKDFEMNVFERIDNVIISALLQNRALLKSSTTWQIDVEDIYGD